MKKITILLCVLMSIALATSTVIGILLIKKTTELSKKTKEIASLESQIKAARDSNTKKDDQIKELNDSVAEKDNEIKKLNKSISKQKEKTKKAEEAKKVAQIGDYESEDTTGIIETPGEMPEGIVRTLTVDSCDKDSITFSLEETESGSIHIDGFQERVTAILKEGEGNFTAIYGGGGWGDKTVNFKGKISIIDNKTIRLLSNNTTGWNNGEVHTFRKK